MTPNQISLSQIITVLSDADALWNLGCGPNGNSMTFADLLVQLQTIYPENGWTDTLLTSIISWGKMGGSIKEFPEGEYLMNCAMVQVNQGNVIYVPFSPYICTQPVGRRELVPYLL